MYTSLKNTQKIEGWNNNEDQFLPPSNNMLRILQNRIINSVRLQQQFYSGQGSNKKSKNIRPATVRVRPTTSKNEYRQQLQSHPTIDLYHMSKENNEIKLRNINKFLDSERENNVKLRNKSVSHNGGRFVKNKQNMQQKYVGGQCQRNRQKPKGEELMMKKQSLVFKNYNSLKNRRNLNNFHEMEIKMRKCRQQHNKTSLGHKQKVHIVVQSFRKGTEIKIGCCNIQLGEQNLASLGLEKLNEGHYTKLSSRKQKLINRDKEMKKKETDFFADAHLSDPKII